MSIKLECLAKALKINTEFSQEDRKRIDEMWKSGRYSLETSKEEIYAGKILKRISELVGKVEGNNDRQF